MTHDANPRGLAAIGPGRAAALIAVILLTLAPQCAAAGKPFSHLFPEKALVDAMQEGDRHTFSLELLGIDNPNAKSSDDVPLIVLAAETGDAWFVEELLKAGARPDDRDKDSRTALTHAADRGYTEMVRVLLAYKSDPEHQGTQAETALVKAARNGQTDIVRLLIEAGAYVNDADITGRTALALAERAGHRDTATVLREAGGKL